MRTVPHSVTFTVDDVDTAETPLPECRAYEALTGLSGRDAIACSEYTSMVVENVIYNPLVYAVHLAYAGHRPLILSPDMIWLTIAQGIKHHILLNSSEMRSDFVGHTQWKPVEVDLPEGFLPDSPYAEWDSVISEFGKKVLNQVNPDKRALLIVEFSTTGPREHAAFIVNMMEAFQRYFDYAGKAICGIPRITLEGIPQDWERMAAKTQYFDNLGLSWWREHLDPILTHFIRASKGDVDLPHWRSIYKLWKRYGSDKLTGWIIDLFPYLWNKTTGEIYKNKEMGRDKNLPAEPEGPEPSPHEEPEGLVFLDGNENQLPENVKYQRRIEAIDPGLKLDEFTLGLSSASLKIKQRGDRGNRIFRISAGFTGIRQDGETGALKPIIGWAVHNQTKLSYLLNEIKTRHTAFANHGKNQDYSTEFPGELQELYDRFNHAVLFKREFSAGTRIRPRQTKNNYSYVTIGGRGYILNSFGLYSRFADKLEQSRIRSLVKLGERMQQPFNEKLLTMYCIVDLADGSHIAFTYAGSEGWHYIRFHWGRQRQQLSVIATSAEELFEHLLSSPDPVFPDHGYYAPEQEENGWWSLEYHAAVKE